MNVEEAFRYCTTLARSHYENFPVASLLLPRAIRPHIAAVYAFARRADDFADEPEFEGVRMEKLGQFEAELNQLATGQPTDPVFIALKETIQKFNLPLKLFQDLLFAFKTDVTVSRYQTFEDLLHYCRHSADPVGRIVLHIMGYPAPKFLEYSDHICTALQLTNFWQDVSRDLEKGRVYIPARDLSRFNYSIEELKRKEYNSNFKRLITFEVERTREMFLKGKPLCAKMPGRFGLELRLTWITGCSILDKIQEMKGDVLHHRPALKKRDFFFLFWRALRKKDFH
ncbi:MAG: squalene synthase HpnC [Deltaproteobacteria bacterium]|nr:squalene synthase HpnC [Deltaproteobacteria bacterium]